MAEAEDKAVKHNISGAGGSLRWTLHVLRWLAIGAFLLLFVAGVMFKLPWKILVCLAVIPAVGIVAPRRIQPWCWGALTAVLIGAGAWIFWPRTDSGRWRTYRFDEDLVDIVQSRRIVSAPNAAMIYGPVLAEHDETIFDLGYFDSQVEQQTFEGIWSEEEFPQLAGWLEPLGPAIGLLLDAAAIDQCRFPIAHDIRALRGQLRRINQFKGWGRWLIRSANGDMQAGRLEEALDKQLAVLGMARHLYQQQTLFDQAGGFFLEQVAARMLKRYVLEHAESDEELDRIRAALERVEPNWPHAWDGVVETEKLMAKHVAGLLYEIDDRGRTRIHRNAIVSLAEGLGYPVRGFYQHPAIARATALGLWLSIPVTPENVAGLIDRRFDKYSELARQGTPAKQMPIQYAWRTGLNPTRAVDWLARSQMSYYAALNGQYKSHIALGRATTIMIELRRYFLAHNRWPADLAQLDLQAETFIDPLSETAFVYGTMETGFYLYSAARVAVDEANLALSKNPVYDIVFWPLEVPASGF